MMRFNALLAVVTCFLGDN